MGKTKRTPTRGKGSRKNKKPGPGVDTTFKIKYTLNGKDDPPTQKCPVEECSKILKISSIRSHVSRVHKGTGRVKCPICTRLLPTSDLTSHIRPCIRKKEMGTELSWKSWDRYKKHNKDTQTVSKPSPEGHEPATVSPNAEKTNLATPRESMELSESTNVLENVTEAFLSSHHSNKSSAEDHDPDVNYELGLQTCNDFETKYFVSVDELNEVMGPSDVIMQVNTESSKIIMDVIEPENSKLIKVMEDLKRSQNNERRITSKLKELEDSIEESHNLKATIMQLKHEKVQIMQQLEKYKTESAALNKCIENQKLDKVYHQKELEQILQTIENKRKELMKASADLVQRQCELKDPLNNLTKLKCSEKNGREPMTLQETKELRASRERNLLLDENNRRLRKENEELKAEQELVDGYQQILMNKIKELKQQIIRQENQLSNQSRSIDILTITNDLAAKNTAQNRGPPKQPVYFFSPMVGKEFNTNVLHTRHVVVDGANVGRAYYSGSSQIPAPSIDPAIFEYLIEYFSKHYGANVKIFLKSSYFDSANIEIVKDKSKLMQLQQTYPHSFNIVESHQDEEMAVIQYAVENNSILVSNNNYSEFKEANLFLGIYLQESQLKIEVNEDGVHVLDKTPAKRSIFKVQPGRIAALRYIQELMSDTFLTHNIEGFKAKRDRGLATEYEQNEYRKIENA